MKLAEALQERADLNRKIDQLQDRLRTNALVQEGENPPEDPSELLEELNGALDRLEVLMARINLTNSQVKQSESGKTLTELIAARDALKLRVASYRELVSAASQTASRATRSEIRILSAIDVRAVQRQLDALSRELRQTDNLIQEMNWTTELI